MTSGDVISTLEGFGWNYLSTLFMAGVVSYLGLFTVLRRIVFTGVALAQVAAAGVGGAFFIADHPSVPQTLARFAGSYGATLGSFVLTLIAALGVRIRSARGRVGGDAVVGFLYVISAALAVLLVWRSSRGLAELREILAGEVLLTSAGELVVLAVALTIVAVIHVRTRQKFLLVSYDPEFAKTIGIDVGKIDLLFLATFATAVAFSLRAGGLLLVFAFLVVPGMIGLTIGRGLRESTLLSVAVALAGSLAGYLVAIIENLPVAHSISAVLGFAFIASFAVRNIPTLAMIVRFVLLAAGLTAVGVGLWLVPGLVSTLTWQSPFESPDAHRGHNHSGTEQPATAEARIAEAVGFLRGGGTVEERTEAAKTLGEIGDQKSLPHLLLAIAEEDEALRTAVVESIRAYVARRGDLRIRVLATGPDAELAAQASRALVATGHELGMGYMIGFLERDDAPLLLRDEILSELHTATGQAFGYDAFAEPNENAAAIKSWWGWWETRRPR